MTKKHLKRLVAPKTWPVKRKENKFMVRPEPGAHNMEFSLPLSFLLRDVTKHAKTLKEVKYILQNKVVTVDGKRKKSVKAPVGLFDILTFADIKESYRIVFGTDSRLTAIKIDSKESELKPCKIVSKTILSGGKVQLNLFDGKNILVKEDKYKVGDTVVVNLKNEVKDHLALKKDMFVFFTSGSHRASFGKVDEIEGKNIIFSKDGNHYRTSKAYAFVVGKDKAVVKLQ